MAASADVSTATTRSRWPLIVALSAAGSAFSMQQTMVVPALPVLAHELDTSLAWATWVLTGFLLAGVVATPLLGNLGDQFGKDRLLRIVLAAFVAASIGAMLAPNIAVLIVFRTIQGVSSAIYPLAFSVIKDEFPRARVAGVTGIVAATFAIGSGTGTALSGLMLDYFSWRALFFIATCMGSVSFVLVSRNVPPSPDSRRVGIDVPGALTLSAAVVLLLVGLTESSSWGWTSPATLGCFALSALLFVAWVTTELRSRYPMVDVRMLTQRPVLIANIGSIVLGVTTSVSWVLTPNLIQAPESTGYGFGATPTTTGFILLAAPIAGVGTAWLLRRPLASTSAARRLALMCTVAGCGLLFTAMWHNTLLLIVVGVAIVGAAGPITAASISVLVVQSVRPHETAAASGVNVVVRMMSAIAASQFVVALLAADTIEGTDLPSESAFVASFAMFGVLSVALSLLVGVLGRRPARRSTLAGT